MRLYGNFDTFGSSVMRDNELGKRVANLAHDAVVALLNENKVSEHSIRGLSVGVRESRGKLRANASAKISVWIEESGQPQDKVHDVY